MHKSDFFKDCNKYLSNLNFYQHARLINVQTFSDESIKLQEYGDRIPKDLLLKLVTGQIYPFFCVEMQEWNISQMKV